MKNISCRRNCQYSQSFFFYSSFSLFLNQKQSVQFSIFIKYAFSIILISHHIKGVISSLKTRLSSSLNYRNSIWKPLSSYKAVWNHSEFQCALSSWQSIPYWTHMVLCNPYHIGHIMPDCYDQLIWPVIIRPSDWYIDLLRSDAVIY